MKSEGGARFSFQTFLLADELRGKAEALGMGLLSPASLECKKPRDFFPGTAGSTPASSLLLAGPDVVELCVAVLLCTIKVSGFVCTQRLLAEP